MAGVALKVAAVGHKMHILYLHQYFNTLSMSGGTRSYEMARRLVQMGHRVTVITSWREQDGRTDWFVTNEEGIEVHWLPVPYSNHMPYQDRIKAFVRFALGAGRRAAEVKGDIVFATSTPLTIAIPGVLASRKLKIPMVFEVRDLWPELPIAIGALKNPVVKKVARWLESWAYRNSEAVVALSPGMRDGVVRTGYPAERVAVVPNSSDNADFAVDPALGREWRARRPWLGDRPLLAYPGTFGKINGVAYLVDLAKALKDVAPDVRVLLIGDGMEKPLVREKAAAAGVLDVNLFMEDPVSKKEMPAVFAATDMVCSLFVDMTEMQANSANKFFDTLAAGKPIFLNYGGWQADIVSKVGCGIVTWRQSHEQAAKLVAERLSDRAWLEQAGRASKKLGAEYFDRDMLAVKLSEVLVAAQARRGDTARAIASGNYENV